MIRPPYDFLGFLNELRHIRVVEMPAYVRTELAQVSDVRSRGNGSDFQRTAYLRKLRQLLVFLTSRELPPDLTLSERAAYWRLAQCLWPPVRNFQVVAEPAQL